MLCMVVFHQLDTAHAVSSVVGGVHSHTKQGKQLNHIHPDTRIDICDQKPVQHTAVGQYTFHSEKKVCGHENQL